MWARGDLHTARAASCCERMIVSAKISDVGNVLGTVQ